MDSAHKNIILGLFILFSVLSSFLFAIIQSFFSSLSKAMLKRHEEEGDRYADLLLKMASNRQRQLINCLMGKILSGVFCAISVYCLFYRVNLVSVDNFFGGSKVATSSFLTLITASFLLLMFGEIFPRMIVFRGNYERLAKVAKPFNFITLLFYPFTILLVKAVTMLIPEYAEWSGKLSDDEYEDERDRYVNMAKEAGIIEEEEKEMISSVFEFGDTIAREVMVPRPDIVAMPINTSFDKLIELIAEDGHSRFPVYDGSIDKIVGILYVKDILVNLKQIKKEYDLFKLLRKPFFVPETKNLNDLLREFQKKNQHLAVVVDEYGGVSGLVSIEDLLEEIVGEIVDEYDHEEEEAITLIGERSYNVDARQSMPDLEGKLDCKFEYEDAETVGGFVMEKLGRIPVQGEVFEVPQGKFKITETKGNRILKVQITLN